MSAVEEPRSGEYGDAQSALVARLKGSFQRRPGGWWIYSGVDVELAEADVYCPDIVGWRRDRVPERPIGTPIRIRPDGVCRCSRLESRAGSGEEAQLVSPLRGPHYWLVDPVEKRLSVLRWMAEGYLLVLAADGEGRVRAEIEPTRGPPMDDGAGMAAKRRTILGLTVLAAPFVVLAAGRLAGLSWAASGASPSSSSRAFRRRSRRSFLRGHAAARSRGRRRATRGTARSASALRSAASWSAFTWWTRCCGPRRASLLARRGRGDAARHGARRRAGRRPALLLAPSPLAREQRRLVAHARRASLDRVLQRDARGPRASPRAAAGLCALRRGRSAPRLSLLNRPCSA